MNVMVVGSSLLITAPIGAWTIGSKLLKGALDIFGKNPWNGDDELDDIQQRVHLTHASVKTTNQNVQRLSQEVQKLQTQQKELDTDLNNVFGDISEILSVIGRLDMGLEAIEKSMDIEREENGMRVLPGGKS
jgi:chromosome segregation ATPase